MPVASGWATLHHSSSWSAGALSCALDELMRRSGAGSRPFSRVGGGWVFSIVSLPCCLLYLSLCSLLKWLVNQSVW